MSNRKIEVTPLSKNVDPPSKRFKTTPVEQPNGQPAEQPTVNIDDLNTDCLERIFQRLELNDLLNVADVSQQILQAARLTVKSKYGKTSIKLLNGSWRRPIEISPKAICISDFGSCLKYVRCFGQSISALTVCYSLLSANKKTTMDHYLNKYCADSITALNYGGSTLKNLTKQFKCVENLVLYSYIYVYGRSEIKSRFPNVRYLNFDLLYGKTCLAVNFPRLEHLDGKFGEHESQSAMDFIRLNPQLRFLKLRGRLDLTVSEAFSAENALECLDLSDFSFNISKECETKSYNVKGVKKLITGGCCCSFQLTRIAISFDQLEEIIIGSLHQQSIIFVGRNPSIKKFTCESVYGHLDDQAVLLLAKSLPSVEEIRILLKLSYQTAS